MASSSGPSDFMKRRFARIGARLKVEERPWIGEPRIDFPQPRVEARELGFLRETDPITMNRDRLIQDAKQTALAMVREGYTQPHPRTDIPVLGEAALSAIKLAVHMMVRGGFISEYDAHVARKLAYSVFALAAK